MKFIEALNLIFKYKIYSANQENPEEKLVLKNVSLQLNQGDFIGILGNNGSGKSTLAKQLTALLKPTDGVIYIKGMDTSQEENTISIRKTSGMVFQNPDNQLIGNVVEEDVAFGPENLGLPEDVIWNRITEALEATGMSAYRLYSPQALSGGQKQKIAISGILAMEPECIVLDEPTAMLDPGGRKEVLEAIWRLNKEKNITIIYITHHIDEIENADYLYVMDAGELVLDGKPSELWEQAENLEKYDIPLPFLWQLIRELKKEGILIPKEIQTREKLLHYLENMIV